MSDATIPVWLPRSYVESRAKQAATMPETLRLACVEALRAAHDSSRAPSPRLLDVGREGGRLASQQFTPEDEFRPVTAAGAQRKANKQMSTDHRGHECCDRRPALEAVAEAASHLRQIEEREVPGTVAYGTDLTASMLSLAAALDALEDQQ